MTDQKEMALDFSFQKRQGLNNLKHDLNSAVSLWFVETKNRMEQKRRMLKRVAGEALFKENTLLIHHKDLVTAGAKRILLRPGIFPIWAVGITSL